MFSRFKVDLFALLMPLIEPRAFIASFAIALICCCVVGTDLSNQNIFPNFQRFFFYTEPLTDFFPTISQMRAIAKDGLRDDQILVIAGGNSILNGIGQQNSNSWATVLQKKLGPHYKIVNLAQPGAQTVEAGYVVFCSMVAEHPKTIFITDSLPAALHSPDFSMNYSYIFWDGLARGLVKDSAELNERIASRLPYVPLPEREAIEETKLRAKIDNIARATDLWTTVGFRNLFTVWTTATADTPFKARNLYIDNQEPAGPVEKRFLDPNHEVVLIQSFTIGLYNKDEHGNWIKRQKPWIKFDADASHVVPKNLRSRMLVFLTKNAPPYLHMLSNEEQERDRIAYDDTKAVFDKYGYNTEIVGDTFEPIDYNDRAHFTPSGGAKLADIAEMQVKQMVERLEQAQWKQ